MRHKFIFVRQTLTQNAEIKARAKNETNVRSIHIPSKLVDELKIYRKQVVQEKLLHGQSYHDNDLVVCTRDGKPMIPRNFRKEFYNLTEKIDLPKIRFHDLKNTHATILIQQNVKLISERLVHADIETTLNTYSQVLPDMQRSVSDKLDKIYRNVTKCVTATHPKHLKCSHINVSDTLNPYMPEEGIIEEGELKIHQASPARYFEDFLNFVEYGESMPEIVKTQVVSMLQEHFY